MAGAGRMPPPDRSTSTPSKFYVVTWGLTLSMLRATKGKNPS
jgi:hypothetical protein